MVGYMKEVKFFRSIIVCLKKLFNSAYNRLARPLVPSATNEGFKGIQLHKETNCIPTFADGKIMM